MYVLWRELLVTGDTIEWRFEERSIPVTWPTGQAPIAGCWGGQLVIGPHGAGSSTT